jgi:hypothetical protein
MDDLEQTKPQFWMPALVAASVIFGPPLLYVLGYGVWAALTGEGFGYD